ncbi:MAG: VIT1/CCC1 transporter family protein [Marinilabiliaceae bacterium]|nr:VIT1/CCC1 transporter family protein [Marinilabiliaceae bacterium]
MELTPSQRTLIVAAQRQEITSHHIYRKIAEQQKKHPENREVLYRIAEDEIKHYNWLKRLTQTDVSPIRSQIVLFSLISKTLGPTFAIKLLEKNEERAQVEYGEFAALPQITDIMADEERHEQELIAMISEERLNYMGSVVLGLNDALVELTGALAGLTFALQNPQLIALTGSITGIAAAFSMAASEYLSTKSEENGKKAIKASWYTGVAYIFTVMCLIMPFLLLDNVYLSLSLTLSAAALIIAGFNYYYAVVKDEKFGARFTEMILLSFGVAALSFGVGWALRHFMGIEV